MSRAHALIGSALFFLAAPAVVAGFMPWMITHWRAGEDASLTLTIAGAALTLAGAGVLIDSFIRFALAGGTPAPLAPTQRLVVTGAYRFVRNPMYAGVLAAILGQMLIFASAALLAYGVAIWAGFQLFIIYGEEPRLKRDYPDDYPAYASGVRRWLPRLTPWRRALRETDDEAHGAQDNGGAQRE